MALSTKQVNAAIAHTGLTVCKIDNSYFVLSNEQNDIVASVYVSSLSHLTKAQWVEEAEAALQPVAEDKIPAAAYVPRGQMAAARQALEIAGGDMQRAIKYCLKYFKQIKPMSKHWEANKVAYVKGYLAGAQRAA